MRDPSGTVTKIEDALARLRLEVQQLKQENEKLKEEVKLQESLVQKLKGENSALKERLKLQEPLVQVGVAIRRRFFEQAKELRGHGRALDRIIEAGNAAAHRGNYIADWAMFKMGYMRKEELILNHQVSAGSFEVTYTTLYYGLYSRMPPTPSDQWMNLISNQLSQLDLNDPLKGVELYNLNANIASCCPGFEPPRKDHDLEDFNRFCVLAGQFVRAYCDMEKRVSTESELNTAFDTCPDIEHMLKEMREITERVVRIHGIRHRR